MDQEPATNLGSNYRLVLGACFAMKWRLAGFLAMFFILTAFVWASYYWLIYETLSQTIPDVKDAVIISMAGKKSLGAVFYVIEVGTLSLLFYGFIDDGKKSVWSAFKGLMRRWRALLITAIVFALISIATFYVLKAVGDNVLVVHAVDIVFRAMRYLLLIVLLISVLEETPLHIQAAALAALPSVKWRVMILQLILLAAFFNGFAYAYGLIDERLLSSALNFTFRLPLYIVDTVVSHIAPAIVFTALVYHILPRTRTRTTEADIFS